MLLLLDILIYSLLDPLHIRIQSSYCNVGLYASKIEFLLQEVLFFRKGGETYVRNDEPTYPRPSTPNQSPILFN